MTTLQQIVGRSLWVVSGAAVIMAAGCAGMSDNGGPTPTRTPTTLSGAQEVPPVTTS
jgi:hypothetical protein